MQGEYLILDLRSLCWKGLVEYPLGRIVQYCELLLMNRISNNSKNETGRWQTFKVQRYDQGVISWCDWHPNAFRRPHCRACKWRIHEMIQSETLSYGLFSHRRYYFHWLNDDKFSQPCKTTKMDEITFDAMYDWKIDSYQPKDKLSTMRPTSAPSRDLSNSAEETPSLRGINLFSFVIAMWIGMRQRNSTSHSPARKQDIPWSADEATNVTNSSNVTALISMLPNSSPVGFLVVLSNTSIISL